MMAKPYAVGSRTISRRVGCRAAKRGAPVVTELATGAFDAGQTVYGDARPAGVDGNDLSLVKSGSVRGSLRFVANGTQIRCTLGPKHMRYLVGKYKILPNNALPFRWRAKLAEIVRQVGDEQAAAAMAGVARKVG